MVELIIFVSYFICSFFYIIAFKIKTPTLQLYGIKLIPENTNEDFMVAHKLLMDTFYNVTTPIVICLILTRSTLLNIGEQFKDVLNFNLVASFIQLLALTLAVFPDRVSARMADNHTYIKYATDVVYYCANFASFFMPGIIMVADIVFWVVQRNELVYNESILCFLCLQ